MAFAVTPKIIPARFERGNYGGGDRLRLKQVKCGIDGGVSNSNYVVPLDNFSNSSCITRPLAEILRDLNKRIPDTIVNWDNITQWWAPLAIQFQLLRKLLSAKLVPGLVLACICIMKMKWPVFKLLNFCFGWMWIEVAVRYFYKALSSIVENVKPCLLFMRIRCLCVFRFLLLLRYIYGFMFCKLWWPKAFH